MTNQRKLGAVLSYVAIIINNLIVLVYTPFMLRMIGQSEYGLYSLVSSVIGYLAILDFGFGNGLIVFTSKLRAQKKEAEIKKVQGMFLVVFIIIGVIASILGLILLFCFDGMFGSTMSTLELEKAKIMMLILIINLAITFPFSIYSVIISAHEKFVFQKIVAIGRSLLNPIIMIPLLLMGSKSITMVLVLSFLNVLILASNYLYCRKKLGIKIKFEGFDGQVFKRIFNYSFFIFLIIIVDKINWNSDQFILGTVSGTIAVSLYALAKQFNNFFLNLATAISSVMLPKISKMVSNNATNEELTTELIKSGRIQYLVIFLAASGLVLFGQDFIVLWAGSNYRETYYIALILILPLCLELIQNVSLAIIQAKEMHKFRAILYIGVALINILISIPLAKTYGGIGAAIGTGLSLLIGNVLIMDVYYYKKVGLNMKKFWQEIIKMTIPFIIPILIAVLGIWLVPVSGFHKLVIFIPLYIAVYGFMAYFFSMNDYEKTFVKNIIRRVIKHEKKN